MKPIKLVMEAFGPYVQRQEIDFTRFDGQNLFVITGPTGAGKTTIFDAISFALFGDSSGDSRESENFKSDYASDDAVSLVEFSFFLKGNEYQIVRYPKQTRLTSRGKLRFLNADAILTLPDGSQVTGVRNVDPLIVEILGISKDRFKQIAMLPQGEYKKLLYASSREKQEIFRKVFSTQDYLHITEALLAQTKKMEEQLSEQRKNIQLHLSMYRSKEEELTGLLNASEQDLPRIFDGMEKENAHLEQLAKEMETDANALSAKLQALGIPEAQRLNARFDLFDQVEQQYHSLMGRREEAVRWKEELACIAKAKELSYAQAELATLSTRLKTQTDEIERSMQALKTAKQEASMASEQQKLLPELQQQKESLAANISTLQQERDTVSLLEQAKKEQVALHAVGSKLKTRETIFHLLLQRKDRLQTLDSLNTQQQLTKELLKDVQRFWKASEEYTSAQQAYDALYTAFLQGQAGLLAASLKDGVPCPVCGSVHHPSPAISKQKIPSERQLEQCKQELDKATQLLREIDTSARITLEKLNTAWSNPEESLGLEPDRLYQSQTRLNYLLNDFQAQAKTILNQIQMDEKELLQYPGITPTLLQDPKYQQEDFLTQAKEKNAQNLTEQTAKMKAVEERISTLTDRLKSGAKTTFDLEKMIETAKMQAASLQKQSDDIRSAYQKAQETLVRAQEALNSQSQQHDTDKALYVQKQTQFSTLLTQHGFSSQKEFEDVLSLLEKEQEIQALSDQYQKDVTQCESQLHLLRAELEGKHRQDLESLKAQEATLKEQQKQRTGELSALQALLLSNREHYAKAKELYQVTMDQQEEFARVSRLSRIASGNNEAKVDFERYVLAAYFDDIIEASNQRLGKMTGYRYLLRRKLERGKYAKASGLDFEVIDSWNGKARDITTLSGGESFQASLALALGVADVMQMVSGGIEMNTMFIDEGFGTLDSQSLDEAIRTLTDLTSENRLIGIISHVADLKERIPAHVEVSPSRTGSSIQVIV